MQPEFWHERWKAGQIGFHQSAVESYLTGFWPDLGIAADACVFVPLCGKSLDLLWLRGRGHRIVGVELSALAIESFCMENGIAARRRTVGNFEIYEAEGLRLLCGDFFLLTPEILGSVAAVYDRAALISWTPELRVRYAEHMLRLTTFSTQTLLIALDYLQAQMQGPPFSISAMDVQNLYGAQHSIEQLDRRDISASEPRLMARGLTELNESCYRLKRR